MRFLVRTAVLGCLLLPVAQLFAASHPSKSAEPEMTYDDALKGENSYLSQIQGNPGMEELISDDPLLKVIDNADKAGKAEGLTPEIRTRLEKYRKDQAAETALKAAPWQHGPAVIRLAGPASLQLPKGYKYLSPADADRVREATGNGASDSPLAFLGTEEDAPDPWVGVLDMQNTGHFTPNQLTVDSDAFLKAINDNKDPLAEMQKIGSGAGFGLDSNASWQQEPKFDSATSIFSASHSKVGDSLGEDEGKVIVFGRRWTVLLKVTSTSLPKKTMDSIDRLMQGLHFDSGEAYADAKPDDPMAEQTLQDLVVGPINPGKIAFQEGIRRATARPSIFDYLFSMKSLSSLGLLLLMIGRLLSSRKKKTVVPSPTAQTVTTGAGNIQNPASPEPESPDSPFGNSGQGLH
jgi:uncharacterized membrane-anchored protein